MTTESATSVLELPASTPAPGAHYDGKGATFALFSSVAEAVELCLFDDAGAETCWSLQPGDGSVWQGYLPEARPGQRYGFRVHGPWDPASGSRCNPAKLLLDPYARAIVGDVHWHPAVYGHVPEDPNRPDDQDSAPYVPRSVLSAVARSTGARSRGRPARWPTRSSTRCTSEASRRCTPTYRSRCAGHMPAWRIRPRWPTSSA